MRQTMVRLCRTFLRSCLCCSLTIVCQVLLDCQVLQVSILCGGGGPGKHVLECFSLASCRVVAIAAVSQYTCLGNEIRATCSSPNKEVLAGRILVAMTKLVLLGLCAGAVAVQTTLLSQATGLLQDLHTKVTADAAAEVDAFKACSSRCKEQAQDDGHQETLMANIATTKVAIENDAAKVETLDADVSSLAHGIASSVSELKEATEVRAKDAKDLSGSEAELMDDVETLQRAISIVQEELASQEFLYFPARELRHQLQCVRAVIDAAACSSADMERLVAFVQSRQVATDDDSEMSVPAAACHSSDIIDVLNGLLAKAETELDDTRHAESNDAHNFPMLSPWRRPRRRRWSMLRHWQQSKPISRRQ